MLSLAGSGERLHLIIYSSVQLVLIVLLIICLALNDWFKYCFWEFGLVYAHSFRWRIRDVYDDTTISGVRDDWCEDSDSVEYFCPSFCTYISSFESAGGFMVFIGVVTLLSAVATVVMHVLALFGRPLKHWLVWVWMPLPAGLWLLGTVIYGGVTNLAGIDDVRGHHPYDPKNAEVEGGLILCAILVVLQCFLLLYGLLTSRKAFIRT